MIIGNKLIGEPLTPYIIAEIGVNHGGSIDIAKQLIEEAAASGAHAVKFQTYKAERIASRHSPAYWDQSKEPTSSQFELFKKYDSFGEKEYVELAGHSARHRVDFLSTPFDLDAVDFLDPLVPAFKIASADITNVPLLRKVGRTGKPVVLSTGGSTLAEIGNAVELLRGAGCADLALLHCMLNYPTPPERAQLMQIQVLKRIFADCPIGYSDHVAPDETISALEAATLLGASILEKHFTHDKTLPGNDHYHAMDRHDLERFVSKLKTYRVLVGVGVKALRYEEIARKHARRSIVAARRIERGEVFSEDNLIAKRPGHGISPLCWDEIVGRKSAVVIEDDELLRWSQVV